MTHYLKRHRYPAPKPPPYQLELSTHEGRLKLRAMHTCISAVSSMNCTACNRGVPYPAMTIEEITDAFAAVRGGLDPRPVTIRDGQGVLDRIVDQAVAERRKAAPRQAAIACSRCGHVESPAATAAAYQTLIPRDPPSLNRRLSNTRTSGHAYRKVRNEWLMWVRRARLEAGIPYVPMVVKTSMKSPAGLVTNESSWPVALGKRRVTITRIYGGKSKRRDHDNFVGGLKPVLDAMVLERLITDDSDDHVDLKYVQRPSAVPAERGLELLLEVIR